VKAHYGSERRIPFAGWEHQWRETHARHVHHTSEDLSWYGDGRTVLMVSKARGRPPICTVIGEGGDFGEYEDQGRRYEDFFDLPDRGRSMSQPTSEQMEAMARFHLRHAAAYRKVGKIQQAEAAERLAKKCEEASNG
jgi:hypothetical protein